MQCTLYFICRALEKLARSSAEQLSLVLKANLVHLADEISSELGAPEKFGLLNTMADETFLFANAKLYGPAFQIRQLFAPRSWSVPSVKACLSLRLTSFVPTARRLYCTHTHLHTLTDTYTHTHTQTHKHTRTHTHTLTHTHNRRVDIWHRLSLSRRTC